ncbi:hypothetical protein MCOR25_008879 [Pyricularia grisea]|nr:hypothetical protein MCOR25_008879 [Pyricularia grisea]
MERLNNDQDSLSPRSPERVAGAWTERLDDGKGRLVCLAGTLGWPTLPIFRSREVLSAVGVAYGNRYQVLLARSASGVWGFQERSQFLVFDSFSKAV